MSDHESFMRTIRELPNEDAPRLVYADWLEENGFAPLAEFIRVQIEIDRSPDDDTRKKELAQRESDLWRHQKSFRRLPPCWTAQLVVNYRRGLLEIWRGSVIEFLRYAEELWNYGPVNELHIAGKDSDLTRLAKSPFLAKIRTLQIVFENTFDLCKRDFVECPFFKELKSLKICGKSKRIAQSTMDELSLRFGSRVTFTLWD